MRQRDFLKLAKSHGFRVVEMGGGCQALESENMHGTPLHGYATFRLTTEGEPTMPWHNEPCTLSYEEGRNGQSPDVAYRRTFPRGIDALTWLENAEYVLPFNGDGPEANGWTEEPV